MRRGLRVRGTCSAACRVDAKLSLDRATARRLRISRTIGRASESDVRRFSFVVGLTKKARRRLGRARRFSVTLTVVATADGGRSAKAVRTIRFR